MVYKNKYIKYKLKYINLKNILIGGLGDLENSGNSGDQNCELPANYDKIKTFLASTKATSEIISSNFNREKFIQEYNQILIEYNIQDLDEYVFSSNTITQNDIKNPKYCKLLYLDISSNPNVTNINHLKQLQVLNCADIKCAIEQTGIEDLTQIESLGAYNSKITSIAKMKNLKLLNCGGSCKIKQDEIEKATSLIELYVNDNEYINDVNNNKNLKILRASGKCCINFDGIAKLKELEILEITKNKYFFIDINDRKYLIEFNKNKKSKHEKEVIKRQINENQNTNRIIKEFINFIKESKTLKTIRLDKKYEKKNENMINALTTKNIKIVYE